MATTRIPWPATVRPRSTPDDEHPLLIGNSPEMRQILHIIDLIGCRRATVLITGETGPARKWSPARSTAQAPAATAPRRRQLQRLPDDLLEAELFGHVRGRFHRSHADRTGRFEQAQGGTLFLDEIGDLPLELQAKLLRVLQNARSSGSAARKPSPSTSASSPPPTATSSSASRRAAFARTFTTA